MSPGINNLTEIAVQRLFHGGKSAGYFFAALFCCAAAIAYITGSSSATGQPADAPASATGTPDASPAISVSVTPVEAAIKDDSSAKPVGINRMPPPRKTPVPTGKVTLTGNLDVPQLVHVSLNKAVIASVPVNIDDVFLSNPSVADVVVRKNNTILFVGKEVGSTNAILTSKKNDDMIIVDLHVEFDATALQQAINKYVSGAVVSAHVLNNDIVLTGSVNTSADADKAWQIARRFVAGDANLVNLLNIEKEEQVLLQVNIVEIQRNAAKQLGIDLTSSFSIGSIVNTISTANGFSVAGQPLGGLSALSGNDSLTGLLQAFEQDGLLHVLAKPNLTAVSGESANFLAGGEFPVPVGLDRNGNIVIEFKSFGVGLGFTPIVVGDGRLNLKISTEVSQLSNQNQVVLVDTIIPGLAVRRTETTVELPSGGSLVIGGLLQRDIQKVVNGVPGMMDVPILGTLFRSTDFKNNETELVIIVTPYLVSPGRAEDFATPADGFVMSSDFGTFFLGELNRKYGTGTSSGKESGKALSWQGPAGYIME